MSNFLKLLAMAAAGSAMMPYDARPKRSPLPKHKAEQPKCKTCSRFYSCTKTHGTMSMACDSYERKKSKKK